MLVRRKQIRHFDARTALAGREPWIAGREPWIAGQEPQVSTHIVRKNGAQPGNAGRSPAVAP